MVVLPFRRTVSYTPLSLSKSRVMGPRNTGSKFTRRSLKT